MQSQVCYVTHMSWVMEDNKYCQWRVCFIEKVIPLSPKTNVNSKAITMNINQMAIIDLQDDFQVFNSAQNRPMLC